MTTASHAAAGALVGSLSGSPVLGFTLGMVSHAVMDIVPHYDLEDYRVDVVLTVLISLALFGVSSGEPALVWGVIGGVLPDLENLFYKLGWMRSEQRLFPTHGGPLPHGRALGIAHGAWQLAIVVLAFWQAAT
jgi:hypothetical protein